MLDDVIVIGAGVVGCATAHALSRYRLNVKVLEAASDVAEGATKANSAIVHAGFDAKPGTEKARFNVAGNACFASLCRELSVPFIRNGSLVVAFSEEEKKTLQALLERGRANGVPGLEILDQTALRLREPGISPAAFAALFAPTGGICCPYDLTFRLAENAAANGVAFLFNRRVKTIHKEQDGTWRVETEDHSTFAARCIVNAAGVFADTLNNQVSRVACNIEPRRGEYFMMDKSEMGHFHSTIFQVPTPMGKGVLVSPTVDGTMIFGPTSDKIDAKTDTATTAAGLAKVKASASKVFPDLPMRKVITAFSGIRAHETTTDDFIIGEAPDAPGFFNALGIESPGLSAAPAIGQELAAQIARTLRAARKANVSNDAGVWPRTRELSPEALADLVKRDPAFGHILCRCEMVSEGEIRAAIRCRVGARTLDGIKRRTRAGMGRCQGGFCTPRLIELLSEELGLPQESFLKSRRVSEQGGEREPCKPAPPQGSAGCREAATREKGRPAVPATRSLDVLVIGAGPAGLAAALAAHAGGSDVLILERDDAPGGILQQCIHTGFGLHRFKEELTGPEYAQRFIDQVHARRLPIQCRTMVLDVTPDRLVTAVSPEHGVEIFQPKAIVLAMGCRERTRGALLIPGTRPAGVYTAGTAQRLVNMEGLMPGRRVVILGSGDIGLIMARRMTFQGAKVLACVELLPFSSGLKRNVVQCLDDFGIPLLLSHTVTQIHGKEHVEGVTIARVDEKRQPVPGTEQRLDCDTLLLSVGLIPENELAKKAGVELSPVTGGAVVDDTMQTGVPGVFACGNALHVHDLVDDVSEEAETAGRSAARFAASMAREEETAFTLVEDGYGVRGCVPQKIHQRASSDNVAISFRPAAVYRSASWRIRAGERELYKRVARILTPGETVRAAIPLSLFQGIEKVTVEVVQEGK